MSAEARAIRLRDERVIHVINKFISLNDDDTKRNNEILKYVIDEIVDVLKRKHEFFRDHFQNIVFAGSYYKGTKVGKPDEFDLNLIIRLPLNYESIKFERDYPGFIKLKLNKDGYLPKWQEHSKLLSKWVSPDGYLSQDKFRQWMESLFDDMPKLTRNGKYRMKVRKSGPAFTLYVDGPGLSPSTMCVDLVPVLEFKNQLNPLQAKFGLRDERWYAVPKPFRADQGTPPLNWRPSFYSFEKNMLKKDGKYKQVIRQVKKLRDTQNWKPIASYHIETLFMHEIIAINSDNASTAFVLQRLSGIELFLHMLQRLRQACAEGKILNFWDRDHNLIGHLSASVLSNIEGRLARIIKDIKADPLKIANFVLLPGELLQVGQELEDIRNGGAPGNVIQPPPHSAEPQEAQGGGFFWNLFQRIFGIMI